MNDLTNFNEIFKKDVTYDNIKSHKKTGFYPLFRRRNLQKLQKHKISLIYRNKLPCDKKISPLIFKSW